MQESYAGNSGGEKPETAGDVNPLFQRLALITGRDGLEKIARTRVLVIGLGGVGGWCAEALVRSGIGKIGIVDFDTIADSNINRQIQATSRTVGQAKADVLKERLTEINPGCEVSAWNAVFSRENAGQFGIENADYVIDAIDILNCKLDLIEASIAAGATLFSSMGMAQKTDPTRIRVADIWKTHGCPLARLVRENLRKRNFSGGFTAVYSDESIARQGEITYTQDGYGNRKITNGSVVTVTACAGMILASLVLCDITERQ